MADIECEVLVVGGSLGGVAAAIRAAAVGAEVHLLAETDWIGGQMTAQGVSTPDEWQWINQGGCTQSYQDFRHRVRAHYRKLGLSPAGQSQTWLSPGNCWVNDTYEPADSANLTMGLSVEPLVGRDILRQMAAEHPSLTIHEFTRATSAEMSGDAVAAIRATKSDGSAARFVPKVVIDATDLGDLLPLTMSRDEWVIGAESHHDTGEPDAPPEAHPDWIQPFTMPFAVELCRGEVGSPIPKPDGYEQLKRDQSFGWKDGEIMTLFGKRDGWWTYRRIIDASNFAGAFKHDIAQINTKGNDFLGGVLPTGDAHRDAQLVEQARQVSLAYLYWLQNECPHDEGTGFPEFHLATDAFGTDHGIAPQPYIRESRRIRALNRVLEQQIVACDRHQAPQQTGIRAEGFADSCGIGKYQLDMHRIPASGQDSYELPTKPHQIPLGCLIPERLTNLLAGCKNLGVTHLTSAAYRLHPVEWNTGEAAGALAAYCVRTGLSPHAVWQDPNRSDPARSALWMFQKVLLGQGVPLYWWPDVAPGHAAFTATQAIAMWGYWTGAGSLTFEPDGPLTADVKKAVDDVAGDLPWPASSMSRGEAAIWLAERLGLV